jgi:hypothetical protein
MLGLGKPLAGVQRMAGLALVERWQEYTILALFYVHS